MSIKSIDFQVLLPKVPEVQKLKHVKAENYKNNQQINIMQDSIRKTEDLKRINKSDKAYKMSINKDKEKNKKNGGRNDGKKDKRKNEKLYTKGSKIDIQI